MEDDDIPMEADEQKVGESKDLTPDGGVKKLLKKAGEAFEVPRQGAKVSVHYVGRLDDGSEAGGDLFDSSRDRGTPFEFNLGKGNVIRGWDIGVATMRKGEISILTCAPEYAYGAGGSPPKIGPNATLKFEVELLNWEQDEDISKSFDKSLMKTTVGVSPSDYKVPRYGSKVKLSYTVRRGGPAGPVASQAPAGTEVEIGESELEPRGLRHAIKKLKAGERAHVTAPVGSIYNFPGAAEPLWMDIHVEEFDSPKEPYELGNEEKAARADELRAAGNKHFAAGAFTKALSKYKASKRVTEYVETPECKATQFAAQSNIAAVYLGLKDFPAALAAAAAALKLQPGNVKALLRHARAAVEVDDYVDAERDIEKVLDAEPANTDAVAVKLRLKERRRAQDEKEKSLFGSMFAKMAKMEAKDDAASAAAAAAAAADAPPPAAAEAPTPAEEVKEEAKAEADTSA